jgi:hypothetical protein
MPDYAPPSTTAAVILILFTSLIVSILIALNFGKYRKIGPEWTFFYLFFGGLILGLIILLSSPEINSEHPRKGVSKNVALGLMVFFLLNSGWTYFVLLLTKEFSWFTYEIAILYALCLGTTIYFYGKLREMRKKKAYTGLDALFFWGWSLIAAIPISAMIREFILK